MYTYVLPDSGYICYDDGCHLRKFARNPTRKDVTPIAKQLASLEILVDKMHMAGHVDKWCKKIVMQGTSLNWIM